MVKTPLAAATFLDYVVLRYYCSGKGCRTRDVRRKYCFLVGVARPGLLLGPRDAVGNGMFRFDFHKRFDKRLRTGEGGRGEGCVLGRRDVLDLRHGRSRMTIDPRIPTMP